jgi:serine/threonine-protein kinase OSR1/STK39
LTNEKDLAVKLIDLEECDMDMDRLRQEVAFWSSSDHSNIVKYHGSFLSGQYVHILMEYMAGGSVADILRYSHPSGFADEMIIATILRSITLALSYIHQSGQIHRDVKPGNALVTATGAVKLGDFGVAATLLEEGQRKHARFTRIGTPCYMAPEVLKDNAGHTEKADIWSLGITAIELATGVAPYASLKELDVIQKILKAPPPQLPRNKVFSDEFRDFVKKCMVYDHRKRPSAQDLLLHPFFRKASEDSYIADYVLEGLPPLGDRFESIRGSMEFAPEKLERSPSEVAASCPSPVQWSFGSEDWPTPQQEKKGRFTIKRVPANDETGPATPTREHKKEGGGTDKRIEELEKKVERLTLDNREMKRQIDALAALVMRMAGQA